MKFIVIMAAQLLFLVCFLTVASFGLVWIFEPTIHYYDSVNVNTMGIADYTMKDRYSFKMFFIQLPTL